MPLRVTGRIERYLTAPRQLIYNQKFRAATSKIEFLQQAVKRASGDSFPLRLFVQWTMNVPLGTGSYGVILTLILRVVDKTPWCVPYRNTCPHTRVIATRQDLRVSYCDRKTHVFDFTGERTDGCAEASAANCPLAGLDYRITACASLEGPLSMLLESTEVTT
jgi:hypothetical protein